VKSETEFVEQLKHQFPVRPPVATGIGDDGAVLMNSDGSQTVIVTDMLLDGVHFDVANTTPELVGRKAVAVNLSDLAAMGCGPAAAFISMAVPGLSESGQVLQGIYRGIHDLSEQFEFTVAGGDTNSWDGPLAVNVCMTGQPFGDCAILRSAARPGDSLLVTGALGGSLKSDRHLTFHPRLDVSQLLSTNFDVHAMMDISDGLGIDLNRMMDASGAGCLLTADNIPIHDDVPTEWSRQERLNAALSDGEDFELLIAVPPELAESVRRLVQSRGGPALTVIGTVTKEPRCRMIDVLGDESNLPPSGWQHN